VGESRFFRVRAQFAARIAPDANAAQMFAEYNSRFQKRLNGVFGNPQAGDKYFDIYQKFSLNAARFAAAKALMVERLLTEAREIADPKERAATIKNITDAYNGHYLMAEELAVQARARTARQWLQMTGSELGNRLYPNIKWIKSRSVDYYEPHKAFWHPIERVWAKDDKFWDEHQPGDHWGCKCDWIETDQEVTQGNEFVPKPSAAKGLDGNPAKTGVIFSGEATYFKSTPKWQANKLILEAPDAVVYQKVKTASGKEYEEHTLVAGEQERTINRQITSILLDNDYEGIKLLPIIDRREQLLRERYYGENYDFSKCPDAKIESKNAEFKLTTNRNMSVTIGNAAKQAEIVIVKITDNITEQHINDVIARQWEITSRKNMQEIIVIVNKKVYAFKRS
jgi:hypothetical protein